MQTLSFAYPYAVLLAFLPFFLPMLRDWWRGGRATDQDAVVMYHPLADILARMQKGLGIKRQQTEAPFRFQWRNLCWWLGWLLLVIAAMGPQRIEREVNVASEGVDMVLAVDLSRSMLAMDFATDLSEPEGRITRLDVVKEVVEDFIAGRVSQRGGDRYGLVLFGDHAYVQSPLSVDGISVAAMLQQVEVGMAGDSTAIGDAMALGIRLLKERPANSRVLILLTDGENTTGAIPPKQAAELAKEYNIRFYAIGVGNRDMVPFPEQTPFGMRIVMAQMKLDEAGLKELVRISGGQYFRATSATTLEQIYDRIDRLERTEAESRVRIIAEPLYRTPLVLGCMLLMAYVVWGRVGVLTGRFARRLGPWRA